MQLNTTQGQSLADMAEVYKIMNDMEMANMKQLFTISHNTEALSHSWLPEERG